MRRALEEGFPEKPKTVNRTEHEYGDFSADDICSSISVPLIIAGTDGSISDINPVFARLTGYSREELRAYTDLGAIFDLLFQQNDESQVTFESLLTFEGSKSREKTIDCVLVTKNNDRRYVRLFAFTLSRMNSGQAVTSDIPDQALTQVTDHRELVLIQCIDNTDLMTMITMSKDFEERYKSLFYRSFDLIFIHDFEGKFIDANPAALRLFDYKRNELSSLTFASLLSSDQIPTAFQTLEDIKANGYQSGITEYQLKTGTGKTIFVETNGTLIYRDNKPFAVLCIGRDITERKRTEDLERNFVEKLKFLATCAMDFVQLSPEDDIYLAIGQKLKKIVGNAIVGVNEYNSRTSTLETKIVLGIEKHAETIIKILGKHPVGLTFTLTEEQKKPIRTGKLTKIEGGLYTLFFGTLSKTICSILNTMLNIGPIYGIGFVNKGEIFGVTTIITFKDSPPLDTGMVETFFNQASVALQRWLATHAVIASEGKYQSLTESINDVIYSLTSEGVVDYIGPQITQYGYSPEDILDSHFLKFIASEDHEKLITYFEKTMATGYVLPMEFRVIDKQGGVHWVENNGTVQHDSEGKIITVSGVLRDVTERIETQQSLLVSEAELRKQKEALEQKNIALGEIIEQIEFEKNKIREDVVANIEKTIFPILDKLRISENPIEYIEFLKQALNNVTSTFGKAITRKTYNLTPREIEVCTMVENGLTNKEISHLLGISARTVENHRKKIRKKFDITNKNMNLSTFLKHIQS